MQLTHGGLRSMLLTPTVRLTNVFALISCILAIAFILLDFPKLAGAAVMPWLSLMLLWRPGMLLALYLYIPFYKEATVDYAPIDTTVWLAALCIVAFAIHLTESKSVPVSFALALLVTWCASMLIATVCSTDVVTSFWSSVEYLTLSFIPLLLVVFVANRREHLWQFLRFTFWASFVFSLMGVLSLLLLDVYRLELSSNTIGTGRASILAVLLAPVVVSSSSRKHLKVAIVTIVGLIAALATGSRGPLLFGLLSMVVVYAVWSKWFAYRLIAVFLTAIGAILALYSNWIGSIVPETSILRVRLLLDAMVGASELDQGNSDRILLFEQAIRMWSERPLLGMGPGTFGLISLRDPNLAAHTYPHNALLQAGAEMGTLGFAVLSVLIAWSALNVILQKDDVIVRGVAILAIFAVASSMVSNDLYDNRWLWGMLLLAGSLRAVDSRGILPEVGKDQLVPIVNYSCHVAKTQRIHGINGGHPGAKSEGL